MLKNTERNYPLIRQSISFQPLRGNVLLYAVKPVVFLQSPSSDRKKKSSLSILSVSDERFHIPSLGEQIVHITIYGILHNSRNYTSI